MAEIQPPLRGRRVGRRPILGSLVVTWLLTLALGGAWYFWVYKIMSRMESVVAALPVPTRECPPCQCPACTKMPGDAACPPCQCTCNCGK